MQFLLIQPLNKPVTCLNHTLNKPMTCLNHILNKPSIFCLFSDPYEYRKKRETQSEAEQIEYDQWKVILIETLGNARQDFSFEYIVSHINSTNSPWIKRAGVHALRKYDHEMVC